MNRSVLRLPWNPVRWLVICILLAAAATALLAVPLALGVQQMRSILFIAGHSEWPFQLDHISLSEEPAHTISWPDGEPFVATPAVFVLQDGLITQAADGSHSRALVDRLFADQ